MSLQDAMAARPSRRSFLVSAAALAGGLSLRFDMPAVAGAAGHSELTAWIVISPDESVVVRVARAEMGQGSSTGLAMLAAEELACDWAKVRPELVAAHENLARRRAWGDMSTGNSRSIRASQEMLRRAGATAREMLIAAAAQRWSVPASECRAAAGVITHASGRTTTFGQVAEAAARIAPPERVILKEPKDWTLIGTPQPRFDIPDKIAGKPVYAIDIRVPDMLYAAIRQCPVFTGKVKSVDAAQARGMPGVHRVVTLPAAVAVVAASWWQAKQAADALAVEWDSPEARLSTDGLRRRLRAALDAPDPRAGFRRGDVAAGFRDAAQHIEAEYAVPYLAHATMEPQNCTASVTADGVEVWAPTQNAEATLVAAAAAAGMSPGKVLVHPVMLGGGFGRRGVVQDFVTQAVSIAKETGRPVQLIWTREEDIRHDFYRPLVVARLAAGLDASGLPVAWTVRLAGQSILASIAPGPIAGGTYRQFFEAFESMPYAVPNFLVDYVLRPAPVPAGYWRGVNDTQNAFFKESFVDEMAHAAGQDPYRYRRRLLADQPRHLAVLDAAAAKAGWDAPASAGVFRGIALHAYSDTVCAQVVEISLGDEVRVHRVVSAIDPGHVVDPRSIAMQTEGAVAFALSAALFGEITLADGRVEQSNFHDCRVLRMAEMPEVETVIVPSGGVWGGVGEPPALPLAPALCNAVFAACGRRIRALPLAKHDLKKA